MGAILTLVALGTRLPFRTHYLATWDSANFALALTHFDIGNSQPHAPGYLGFIALGALVNTITHSPNTTFVGIAVAATAAGVALIYTAARLAINPFAGISAALFLIASPLIWFYGDVALVYTLGMAAAAAILAAAAITWRSPRYLPLLYLVTGLSGAVRQDVPLIYALLVLLVTVSAIRAGALRHLPLSAALGLLGVAAWLVPLLVLSGGPAAYLRALQAISSTAIANATPLVHHEYLLPHAGRTLTAYLLGAAGFAPLPFLLLLPAARRHTRVAVGALAVVVPGTLLFTFGILDRLGHVLSVMPALALLVAAPLGSLYERNRTTREAALALTVLATITGVVYFLAPREPSYPRSLLGAPDAVLESIPTAATLAAIDDYWRTIDTAVRAQGPPGTVFVASYNGPDYADWRDAAVTLDAYSVAWINWDGPNRVWYVRCGHFLSTSGLDAAVGAARRVVLIGEGAASSPPGGDRRWRPLATDVAAADLRPGDRPIDLGRFRLVAGGPGPPMCPSH